MSKSDNRYTYKHFSEEDEATFRRWLHANAVIASLFIVMFVALVWAGKSTKEARWVEPHIPAMIDDVSAVSKSVRQDKTSAFPDRKKTIDLGKLLQQTEQSF